MSSEVQQSNGDDDSTKGRKRPREQNGNNDSGATGKCPYEGCEKDVSDERLSAHKPKCCHRPVKCWECNDGTHLETWENFWTHYKTIHSIQPVHCGSGRPVNFLVPHEKVQQYLGNIVTDDLFLNQFAILVYDSSTASRMVPVACYDGSKGTLYFLIWELGPPSGNAFKLQVSSPKCTMEVSKLAAVSYRTCPRELTGKACLSITLPTMRFMTNDGELDLKLRVSLAGMDN